VSEEDLETLKVVDELRNFFSGSDGGTDKKEEANALTPPEIDMELVQELVDLAPELAPGAQAAALRLGSVLFDQAAYRVARATRSD
jgi:hypothetical protein